MLFDLFTKRKKSCMENEILEQAEITKKYFGGIFNSGWKYQY